MTCKLDGCPKPARRRNGYCSMHYARLLTKGSVGSVAPLRIRNDLRARLESKIERTADGCWVWLGGRVDGYGVLRVDHRNRVAHRVAYETLVGPVPEGLQLDHLCRNRSCINPAHLEPVTPGENSRRMWAAKRGEFHYPKERDVVLP